MKKLILQLAALLFALPALAELSAPQMQTLKALALADPAASVYVTDPSPANDQLLADWYNGAGACVVWKTAAQPNDMMRNGMDWTRVDNLSVGKARIWDWMTKLGTLDCSKGNIRAGIDATWVGTAADLAVRATVYSHCKRAGSRAESALATGTCTTDTPGVLVYEGQISQGDAILIRSQ